MDVFVAQLRDDGDYTLLEASKILFQLLIDAFRTTDSGTRYHCKSVVIFRVWVLARGRSWPSGHGGYLPPFKNTNNAVGIVTSVRTDKSLSKTLVGNDVRSAHPVYSIVCFDTHAYTAKQDACKVVYLSLLPPTTHPQTLLSKEGEKTRNTTHAQARHVLPRSQPHPPHTRGLTPTRDPP